MKIRVIKTVSKAKAVQVVSYQNNKRIVLQHIGSAHTAEALNDFGRRVDKEFLKADFYFSR